MADTLSPSPIAPSKPRHQPVQMQAEQLQQMSAAAVSQPVPVELQKLYDALHGDLRQGHMTWRK